MPPFPARRAPEPVVLAVDPVHERNAGLRWQCTAEADHPELVAPVFELPRRVLLPVQLLGRDRFASPRPRPVSHRPQPCRARHLEQLGLVPGHRDDLGRLGQRNLSVRDRHRGTSACASSSATVSNCLRTALAVVPRTRAIHSNADASPSSPRAPHSIARANARALAASHTVAARANTSANGAHASPGTNAGSNAATSAHSSSSSETNRRTQEPPRNDYRQPSPEEVVTTIPNICSTV